MWGIGLVTGEGRLAAGLEEEEDPEGPAPPVDLLFGLKGGMD